MSPEDLVRRNLYDFCHVIDLETLRHAHFDGNGHSLHFIRDVTYVRGTYFLSWLTSIISGDVKNPREENTKAGNCDSAEQKIFTHSSNHLHSPNAKTTTFVYETRSGSFLVMRRICCADPS